MFGIRKLFLSRPPSRPSAAGPFRPNLVSLEDRVVPVAWASRISLSIGDQIWYDSNRNGQQDGTEAGAGGVRVALFEGGSQIATTTSDANGVYSFGGSEPVPEVDDGPILGPVYRGHVYQVKFFAPRGYAITAQHKTGVPENLDSDPDKLTGLTGDVEPVIWRGRHPGPPPPELTTDCGLVTLPTTTTIDVQTVWPGNYVQLPGVVLTARVTGQARYGAPTGTVTFTDGGATVGTAPLSGDGTATYAIQYLSIGDHPFVAQYSGDQTYLPSSSDPTPETVGTDTGTDSETLSSNEELWGEQVGGSSAAPSAPPAAPPAAPPNTWPTSATLSWNDFKKVLDNLPANGAAAAVSTRLQLNWETHYKRVWGGNNKDGWSGTIELDAPIETTYSHVMNPDNSFVVKSYRDGKDKDAILEHERVHLKIGERVAIWAKANEPKFTVEKIVIAGAGTEQGLKDVLLSRLRSAIEKITEDYKDNVCQKKYDDLQRYYDAVTWPVNNKGVVENDNQKAWNAHWDQFTDDFLKESGWTKPKSL